MVQEAAGISVRAPPLEADDEAPVLRLNQTVQKLLFPVVTALVSVRDDQLAAILARESKQEGARRSSGKLRRSHRQQGDSVMHVVSDFGRIERGRKARGEMHQARVGLQLCF